jgi:hypothetical protein
MSKPTKTTVYLDADVYRRIQALARKRGRPAAQLVREAVAEYVGRLAPPRSPRSLGAGRSGLKNLGSQVDRYLKGMGEDW